MSVVHILNQYIWPDAAPTAIYAEQLAVEIQSRGLAVRLAGGMGSYRPAKRSEPAVPRVQVPHWQGKRGSHLSTFREYLSVNEAFRQYIDNEVLAGDVVITTSAPPNTLTLHSSIHQKKALAVYWLQDYYPELIRGVFEYPTILRKFAAKYWASHLGKWDHVVKVAGNLPGEGTHYRVLRNWPTLRFPTEPKVNRKRSALYTGNLGYGHDVAMFTEKCRELQTAGYQLMIHADGPGVKQLPDWICPQPPFRNEEDLVHAMESSEIHLVAAHPSIQHAVFPSKIWNSISAGNQIIEIGFAGAMRDELIHIQTHPQNHNLANWGDFVIGLVNSR